MQADWNMNSAQNADSGTRDARVTGLKERFMRTVVTSLSLGLLMVAGATTVFGAETSSSTGGKPDAPAPAGTQTSGTKSTSSNKVKAIEFSLKDLNNKVWSLKSQQGRVVVVNFWATWCGPCRMELPKLQEISNKLKGQPVTFLSLNVDEADTLGAVKPFVKQNNISLPILLDSAHTVVNKYNPEGIIPYTAIVDAKGYLRHVHQQYAPGDEKIVEQEIRDLLAEVSSAAPAPR